MSASLQHQIELGAQGRGGERAADAYEDWASETEREYRADKAAHEAGRCAGLGDEFVDPCPVCWAARPVRVRPFN